MFFSPVVAAHLSVDAVERFAEDLCENRVKASFRLQQTVFPARGYLVETPVMTV